MKAKVTRIIIDYFLLQRRDEDDDGGARWQYRWTERTEFGKFVISPRMALDHLPFRMLKALENLTH
jgi:hypothetical protein